MRIPAILAGCLAILTFCCAEPLCAQDVSVKGDVILKDGEPYAQMKKSGSMGATFTISALDGTEALTAVYDKVAQDYVLSFASGEEVRVSNTIGFGKVLAKDVVRADLFKSGALNSAGVKRFLAAHGALSASRNGTEEEADVNSGDGEFDTIQTATVKRSRTGDITVMGNNIQQDFKTIGTWNVRTEATKGTVFHTYTFSLPGGEVVAEAVLEGVNAKSARIVTLSDKRRTTLAVEGYNQTGTAKTIAEWLSKGYYL